MKKINLSLYILLVLLLQVIFADNLIYFLHTRYLIANLIALILNVTINIILIKKKFIIVENKYYKWDLIFISILLLLICTTIFFPDEVWDTYSYHLFLQENPFSDKINDDFFPGRTINSFVFPIVDRLFFMFRHTLGFRLGTLPGYLVLIPMFYEVKKILAYLLKKYDIKENCLSVLSIIPLISFVILQQMGTYYIDNFTLVILLEFTYIILAESKDIFKNKARLYYLALMVGIATCIKITTAVYMIGPLIYLLIKNIRNWKEIKWYDYPLLILTAFLPLLPYFINAIVQTGNPVFPYYNSIFKSEYFPENNWTDFRYGPKDFIQFLIWPIFILFNPKKASEGVLDLGYAVGYILIIGYLTYSIFKKFIKKEKLDAENTKYIVLLFYFYLVWEKFLIGYTRYAGIILLLVTMFIIILIIKMIKSERILQTISLTVVLTIISLTGINLYIQYSPIYNYVQLFNGTSKPEYFTQNISQLYSDRINEKYDIDGVWGEVSDDSAVPMLLNCGDRIINLEHSFKTGETEKSDKLYWNNVLNNDIYVPLYTFKLEYKLNALDIYHFEITEINHIMKNVSFLKGENFLYIVKVKYNENFSGNKEKFEQLLSEWK